MRASRSSCIISSSKCCCTSGSKNPSPVLARLGSHFRRTSANFSSEISRLLTMAGSVGLVRVRIARQKHPLDQRPMVSQRSGEARRGHGNLQHDAFNCFALHTTEPTSQLQEPLHTIQMHTLIAGENLGEGSLPVRIPRVQSPYLLP